MNVLKKDIEQQGLFVGWLKDNMMYNPMDSSYVMHRMYSVWKKVTKQKQELTEDEILDKALKSFDKLIKERPDLIIKPDKKLISRIKELVKDVDISCEQVEYKVGDVLINSDNEKCIVTDTKKGSI